jgi:hypothetical protein
MEGVPQEHRAEYANVVWLAFLEKSGQPPTRLMSPAEFGVLRGWMDAGIPLRVVLRALADTKGTGRVLGYFAPSVSDAFEHWRLALSGTR